MILLGWCYSNNGDVCRLFRRHAIFSKMILNHDLRTFTGNPLAKPNKQQEELLEKNGIFHVSQSVTDRLTDGLQELLELLFAT